MMEELTGPKKFNPSLWDLKEQHSSTRTLRADNIKHIFETSPSLRLHVLFGIFAAVELSAEKPPTMKQTDKVGQASLHANNRYWWNLPECKMGPKQATT